MTLQFHDEAHEASGQEHADGMDIYAFMRAKTDNADRVIAALQSALITTMKDLEEDEDEETLAVGAVSIFLNVLYNVNRPCCTKRTHILLNAMMALCAVFEPRECLPVLREMIKMAEQHIASSGSKH